MATLEELDGLRAATVYPRLAGRLLAERGIDVELVEVTGSVEVAPRLGLADAIVDLVSSGNTLRTNGLRSLGAVFASEAVLIGRREGDERGRRLAGILRSVVDARASRYLMLNAPRRAPSRRITDLVPGSRSPTRRRRSPSRGWSRCTRSCRRSTSGLLLPRLEEAGASSILLVPVERMLAMSDVARDRRRRPRPRRRGPARVGASARRRRSPRAPRPESDLPERRAARARGRRPSRGTRSSGRRTCASRPRPASTLERPLDATSTPSGSTCRATRLDARHVRGPGPGGGRRAHRRRHAARRRRPRRRGRRGCSALAEVWALGGPHAIAALAYGTESIPRVDKIVGPGQRVRERGEAARLARRGDRPARRAVRDRRRRRPRRRPARHRRARARRPGRARPRDASAASSRRTATSRRRSPRSRSSRPST